jgi:NADH:ubiquinone oxidoreductase subunit K
MAGMAAFLYLAPKVAIDVWPWPLTSLTSRVIGAWFVLGMFGVVIARDSRWSSMRIVAEAIIVSMVLVLIGVARTWNEFHTGRVATYVFLAGIGSALAFLGSLYIVMERRAGRSPRHPIPAETSLS